MYELAFHVQSPAIESSLCEGAGHEDGLDSLSKSESKVETDAAATKADSVLSTAKEGTEGFKPEPADSAFTNPREKVEEEWQANAAKSSG